MKEIDQGRWIASRDVPGLDGARGKKQVWTHMFET